MQDLSWQLNSSQETSFQELSIPVPTKQAPSVQKQSNEKPPMSSIANHMTYPVPTEQICGCQHQNYAVNLYPYKFHSKSTMNYA